MLIIEGADLVGKTTFVKEAYAELDRIGRPHMPMHLTRPPRNFDYYRGYLEKISRHSIWDRFHLSNIMYRQHDDHPSSMTPLKYDLIESAVRQAGGFIVLLTAPAHVIADRYGSHGPDEMYALDHTLKVNDSFINFAANHGAPVLCRGQHYHARRDVHIVSPFTAPQVHAVVHEYLKRLDELGLL